jgi:hypothetical protein
MSDSTIGDALRLAINVLRDSAESRKMPSGVALDDGTAKRHSDAAQTLERSLTLPKCPLCDSGKTASRGLLPARGAIVEEHRCMDCGDVFYTDADGNVLSLAADDHSK